MATWQLGLAAWAIGWAAHWTGLVIGSGLNKAERFGTAAMFFAIGWPVLVIYLAWATTIEILRKAFR